MRRLLLSVVCLGVGIGSEFFAGIVAGPMGAEQDPVLGDLDGVTDSDSDRLPPVAVAHLIAAPGEADRSVRVDLAQHVDPVNRLKDRDLRSVPTDNAE